MTIICESRSKYNQASSCRIAASDRIHTAIMFTGYLSVKNKDLVLLL
jgi:hypothetical protein